VRAFFGTSFKIVPAESSDLECTQLLYSCYGTGYSISMLIVLWRDIKFISELHAWSQLSEYNKYDMSSSRAHIRMCILLNRPWPNTSMNTNLGRNEECSEEDSMAVSRVQWPKSRLMAGGGKHWETGPCDLLLAQNFRSREQWYPENPDIIRFIAAKTFSWNNASSFPFGREWVRRFPCPISYHPSERHWKHRPQSL